jgi:hypothetical protein
MARASSGMDLNGQIAALLRDFAAVQKSKQSMWGYKRAASAILDNAQEHAYDADIFVRYTGRIIEEIAVAIPERDNPMKRRQHPALGNYVVRLMNLLL